MGTYRKKTFNYQRMTHIVFFLLTLVCLITIVSFFKDNRTIPPSGKKIDVALIGGGIMSATLASMLTNLDPTLTIEIYESLDQVALESSSDWNNAGTGHAGFCELNYTPEKNDGSIDIKKAIQINEQFEISKQFWSYLVQKKQLDNPKIFIQNTPHMSFVIGEHNQEFLRKRYHALKDNPLFEGLEYSENHDQITKWAPLVMTGRLDDTNVAATWMPRGTGVNFGALTHALFKIIKKQDHSQLFTSHRVDSLEQAQDKSWNLSIYNINSKSYRYVNANFVFIGAGGGSLPLLQQSGIEEAKNYGGFPVGGAWLVSKNKTIAKQHFAKLYGKAGPNSPPMSTPHLDTRFIDGKQSLLFGPFATFSTKFLKFGSWTDLFYSLNWHNIDTMIIAGLKNIDLSIYLVKQLMLSKKDRMMILKEYYPEAKTEDFEYMHAGQRVQIIKQDPTKGAILQFGTELVFSKDNTLVTLLGASPGASVSVKVVLDILTKSFHKEISSPSWKKTIQKMIPSYGKDLSRHPDLFKKVRKRAKDFLQLTN